MSSLQHRLLGTANETFAALCSDFQLDPKVGETIEAKGCQNISDFRYFVQADTELKACFLAGLPGLKEDRIQLARLRHAWTACVQYEKLRDERASAPLPGSDEAPLPVAELQSLKEAFWTRHHLKWPPERTPSDRLVSKMVRQIRRRSLDLQDMGKVASLSDQRTAPARRATVGTTSQGLDLVLQDSAEDTHEVKSADQYLHK